jgi:hypothetical protein
VYSFVDSRGRIETMKYFSHLSVGAGLVLCLAAAPARADLATPESASAGSASGEVAAALQALTGTLDAASAASDSSTLASGALSSGPVSLPATSQGVDSSGGPVSSASLTGSGSVLLSGAAAPAAYSASGPALAPAGLESGDGRSLVAGPSVSGTDLSSMANSLSTPLTLTVDPLPEPAPTPIPASILLLAGGLLCLVPLRPAARPCAES